ncbi:MAG: SpoIID/LytB domain-containing protein [candidate division KSB1 bacterium]|nr:SpoIID/LytB domain-containing protein [candidate division KSB1 bacterium]MDZ7273764.1 SpoIID/LytB domain-containing protein [candidate division KSB1 bacterium]MDZ7285920.1 SpoIID/LytB domain-containing protein [candidate division KSB1 bacterium]MDZ7298952.1 SpoIID/LytB domain-containing protein [candidate division KSB1 bacterium]MDZ7349903.1 SpoIID/LytB domain-containing protein [candidate division KSB1 bacterium]
MTGGTLVMLAGWCSGSALFAQDSAPGGVVTIRLFEILAPHVIELAPAEFPHQAFLPAQQPAHGLSAPSPDIATTAGGAAMASLPGRWLEVRLGRALLLRAQRPIRIVRQGRAMHLQSQDFSRTLDSSDTITVAGITGAIAAGVSLRNGQCPFPSRLYVGAFKIHLSGNELCVINLVPVADYLAGVLAAELPAAPLAALQAQAIAARTYLLRNWQRHADEGYQLCDLTHCQRYAGSIGVEASIWQAVTSTAGEILTHQNHPIEIFYSSTCGGRTAEDHGVWSGVDDHVYLVSVADSSRHAGYCAVSPHFRWRWQIDADSLLQIWRDKLGDAIQAIGVSKRGIDGRVRELALMGQSLHLVRGEEFRAVVCRVRGWNAVKSTAFDLQLQQGNYVFTGRGLGHGVGLCQYGAIGMARQGHSYRDILRHYFPGTEIKKYPALGEQQAGL